MKTPNIHNSRETWLRAAANELRPYFDSCGYQLPENIRFAIAFPSTGRKGKRVGEALADPTPLRDSSYIPTRRASEGSGVAPQETCGIPRWRVGLTHRAAFGGALTARELLFRGKD